MLSVSDTSNICYFKPYFSKVTIEWIGRQDLEVSCKAALHIANKLKKSYESIEGLHIFMERFYTSIALVQELCAMKVHHTEPVP